MIGGERHRVHYVVVYRHPDMATPALLLRRLVVDCPAGLVAPPTITLHEPLVGPHEFAHAGGGTQAEIARMYGVTQQTVSRWIEQTERFDAAQAARRAEHRSTIERAPLIGRDAALEAVDGG